MNDVGVTAADLAPLLLLREVGPEDLARVAEVADRIHLEDGGLLTEQGRPADRAYWVLSGRVALRVLHDGQTTLVSTLGPGELLGWSTIREDAVWLTSTRAIGRTDLIAVPASTLLDLLAQGGDQGRRLIRQLVGAAAADLDLARAQLLGPGREGVISAG